MKAELFLLKYKNIQITRFLLLTLTSLICIMLSLSVICIFALNLNYSVLLFIKLTRRNNQTKFYYYEH